MDRAAAERRDVSPRNVWFMVFEIVLRETGVRFASLNTLLYSAARRSSLEVPPLQVYSNKLCVQKGTDIIMIQSLSGEIAFTRHSIAAALIL